MKYIILGVKDTDITQKTVVRERIKRPKWFYEPEPLLPNEYEELVCHVVKIKDYYFIHNEKFKLKGLIESTLSMPESNLEFSGDCVEVYGDRVSLEEIAKMGEMY